MSQSNPENRPILIVDVDETLFDATPRKIAILHDLFGTPATYEEVSADYYLTDYVHSPEQERDFFASFIPANSGIGLTLSTYFG